MKLKVPQRSSFPAFLPGQDRAHREYGADLVIEGDRYATARRQRLGAAIRGNAGACVRSGRDHAGTGTIARARSAAGFDTLLVSSRRRLIAGLAAWYAAASKVIGVEPLAAPTLTKALEAGHPVDAEAAASRPTRLRRAGSAHGFPIARTMWRAPCWSPMRRSGGTGCAVAALRIVAEPGAPRRSRH